MKRRFFSILTALALCLSLLPGTAWAEDVAAGGILAENPAGESISKVYEHGKVTLNNGDIITNDGEVMTNRGFISQVTATGTVNLNENYESGSRRGRIDSNAGHVETNRGYINANTGTVQSNHSNGTVSGNYNNGKINNNDGIVANNQANVGTNNGSVHNQYPDAVVNANYGTVYNANGTVNDNKPGGIVFNMATVVNNEPGGKVYNCGGTVTNNSGDVYWQVTGNTGGVTFSPELADPNYNQYKFIQEGCTITPPDGYIFSTPPTAANAILIPSGNGYTITNITAAPVEHTVSTAASDGIVAKVEQNVTLSYYGDFMDAWDAACSMAAPHSHPGKPLKIIDRISIWLKRFFVV